MSTENSITKLLSGVKMADQDAVLDLFKKCYDRIAGLAHRKLGRNVPAVFDADDVANSAFHVFLKRAATGKFRRLENREDVWQILTLLVGDKISERLRYERAIKRDPGGQPVPIDDIEHIKHTPSRILDLDDPALLVEVEEARSRFLDSLPDTSHRQIVDLLEEGYTREEIAEKLAISLRGVYRRLEVIRSALPRVLGV